MKFLAKFNLYLVLFTIGFVSWPALCAVSITGTRVIYIEGSKEVSVKLRNNGNVPVMLQSWIDDGDAKANPTEISVPFSITPPLNHVNGGQNQTLRLVYSGSNLPKDRESVFWLNVLEIPATKKEDQDSNYLQMAFRTRIKLFFRPSGLEGNANDAVKSLVLQKTSNDEIKAINPTPYHISIGNLYLEQGGKSHQIRGAMISPKDEQIFKFSNLRDLDLGSKIKVTYINDYGALNSFETKIQ